MQNNRVWQRACGLTRTVVEGVRFDNTADAIVVSVRPDARARGRCGRCGRWYRSHASKNSLGSMPESGSCQAEKSTPAGDSIDTRRHYPRNRPA